MKRSPLLPIGAAVVFAAWISWLGFLALPAGTPDQVLSRAQFLASTIDVIAQVDADDAGQPSAEVTIQEVAWPTTGEEKLVGQKIRVANLNTKLVRGWTAEGLYILPLRKSNQHYEVVGVPRSPGFVPVMPLIYSATPSNRAQLDSIRQPGHP